MRSPRTPARQRGLTLVGLLLVVALVVLGGYVAMRLLPLYAESVTVGRSLEALRSEHVKDLSLATTRQLLQRRFDVGDVSSVTPSDVQFTRDGDTVKLHVEWDAYAPLFGNVGFTVHFEKSATVGSSNDT
jgi:Domain of unknown function (DUF4845)